MTEALILTSSKEAAGMGVIDVRTGSNLCSGFKNCIAEAGALCAIGSSTSSYAGYGSCGDYLAVAQAKKPCINIWQWGKPQAHFQCHIQEIVTALVADPQGAFLYAGTKKGWIYCWELSTGELITAFQAHFKAITRLVASKTGLPFCISVSEDGTGRAWELHKLLDVAESYKHVGRQSISPFRTWSAHTLPIRDCILFDTLTTTRVLTCSLDRTVVLYDVLQAQVCLRVTLPHSLESVACNVTQDLVCAGASNGDIYLIDLTSTAIAVTAAHAHVSHHHFGAPSSSSSSGSGNSGSGGSGGALPAGTCVLEGHTKAVTSVSFSADNSSLVSASADGTVRVWNVWTRQCLREYSPLAKHAISNALLIPVPETLSIGVMRPTFCPVSHLNKYFKGQQQTQTQTQTQQQAGASGSGGGAGASSASGTGSSSAGGAEDAQSLLLLGPSFLSRHVQAPAAGSRKRCVEGGRKVAGGQKQQARRLSSEEAVVAVEGEVVCDDDEVVEGEQEEEDYMALSGSFVAPKKTKLGSRKRRSAEGSTTAAAEAFAEAAVQEQLREALAQVAALQQQNSDLLARQASSASDVRSPVHVPAVEEGSARKKAKSVASPAPIPAAVVVPVVVQDAAVEMAAVVEVVEVEETGSPRALGSRDRANRRKSVAPGPRTKTAVEAVAAVESEDMLLFEPVTSTPTAAVTASKDRANRRKSIAPVAPSAEAESVVGEVVVNPAVEVDSTATAACESVTMASLASAASRDRANRRKSVALGKAGLMMPAIDEDAPLQMPAVEAAVPPAASAAAAAAAPSASATRSRRKSVSAKDLPPAESPVTAKDKALAALSTPPAAEESSSDMESVFSMGGTRSRVRKNVQFSGQDHVKLITPHKLPGFCDSFQSGVGSAAKVAAAVAAERAVEKAEKAAAAKASASAKKSGRGKK